MATSESVFDGVAVGVLCGGLGTRLRAALPSLPKVLAPVHGQPFIAHLLRQLERAGAERVVLCTGYLADHVYETLGDRFGGLELVHAQETSPLGTAGALRAALQMLDRPLVLALNGDSYCDVDLAGLIRAHRLGGTGASLAAVRVDDADRFGTVLLDDQDRVVQFEEKRTGRGTAWVNAGIYLVAHDLLREIPLGREVSLEREILPGWSTAGALRGIRIAARLLDIGTPASLAAAEAFFEADVRYDESSRSGRPP